MEYVLGFFGVPAKVRFGIVSAALGAYWHLRDHFLPHYRNNYHPHILSHRSLALFSALLVSVKIFTLAVVSFGPLEPVFSSAITTENIITLTNNSRTSYGLSLLAPSAELTLAAQSKADDMLGKGYFSHTTPDGKSPWDFINSAGYNYLSAGENLAVNFVEAEDVENAWMNSPGHKANILNKSFEEIGIGIAQGQYEGKNAIFVVQMFGTPALQKVLLDQKPTVVAPPSAEVKAPDQKPLKDLILVAKPEKNIAQLKSENRVLPVELKIKQTSFTQDGGLLKLTANILGEPVKVLAKFGNAAVMLMPKNNDVWVGEVNLSNLALQNSGLVLEAQSIHSQKDVVQLASFAGSTQQNFNVLSVTEPENKVNFLGKVFNPNNFEQQFYLIIAATLLSCLILAIAIKRHIQHLSLVANTAFVVILSVGLWLR